MRNAVYTKFLKELGSIKNKTSKTMETFVSNEVSNGEVFLKNKKPISNYYRVLNALNMKEDQKDEIVFDFPIGKNVFEGSICNKIKSGKVKSYTILKMYTKDLKHIVPNLKDVSHEDIVDYNGVVEYINAVESTVNRITSSGMYTVLIQLHVISGKSKFSGLMAQEIQYDVTIFEGTLDRNSGVVLNINSLLRKIDVTLLNKHPLDNGEYDATLYKVRPPYRIESTEEVSDISVFRNINNLIYLHTTFLNRTEIVDKLLNQCGFQESASYIEVKNFVNSMLKNRKVESRREVELILEG
ncbi:MAG: hypothetical protein ACRCX2_13650 [Paraclostridium sp.]